MTNVSDSVEQSRDQEKGGQRNHPPEKKETRKSGRGATCSWNHSFLHFQTVLFFCPHSTHFQVHDFAPLRGRNHTVPHHTVLTWSNFCSQKAFPNDFLSHWYLYVLKVPGWISLFGQWPSPQTPILTWDQVPMTLSHICHNWVRCWAEGGNYSPKSILPF